MRENNAGRKVYYGHADSDRDRDKAGDEDGDEEFWRLQNGLVAPQADDILWFIPDRLVRKPRMANVCLRSHSFPFHIKKLEVLFYNVVGLHSTLSRVNLLRREMLPKFFLFWLASHLLQAQVSVAGV